MYKYYLDGKNDVKTRDLKVQLSDADCARIAEVAGRAGMSVGELLSSFVSDLVGGEHSHGSDERMLAQGWYDRCGFACYNNSFLHYLLEYEDIDDFLIRYGIMKDCEGQLADLESGDFEIGELDGETVEDIQEEMICQKQALQEVYDEYVRRGGRETFEDALKSVLAWDAELGQMLSASGQAPASRSTPELDYEPEM